MTEASGCTWTAAMNPVSAISTTQHTATAVYAQARGCDLCWVFMQAL